MARRGFVKREGERERETIMLAADALVTLLSPPPLSPFYNRWEITAENGALNFLHFVTIIVGCKRWSEIRLPPPQPREGVSYKTKV